jgi:hypothetical protein
LADHLLGAHLRGDGRGHGPVEVDVIDRDPVDLERLAATASRSRVSDGALDPAPSSAKRVVWCGSEAAGQGENAGRMISS